VAVVRIIETDIGPAEYDQMRSALGIVDTPPPGGAFHVAAVGENGKMRIVEVWDSLEQAQAWGDKVTAAREAAGVGGPPPSLEYLEVHSIVQR
jgi:hypothetical protein